MTGERKSVKILGAIELWRTRFDYRQDTVFNAATYLGFLEQLAIRYRRQGAILIQDNASYHKDADVWAWFKSNRHWLEVHQLPPYSPEFNPTERLWQHTRKNGTHNRFFGGLLVRHFFDWARDGGALDDPPALLAWARALARGGDARQRA